MTREQALPYISFYLDNALAERNAKDMPSRATLVGWQCGFEPLFVAVWSYLSDDGQIDNDEAAEIAMDYLAERKWFSGDPREPDYII